MDKYKSLLEQNDIDLDIFVTLDLEEQYDVIEELERAKRDIKREKFIEVQDDLTQFSEI